MKIVFVGCVNFSYHMLKHLLISKIPIQHVFTDKEGKNNSDHYDLSGISNEHHVPITCTTNINSDHNINLIKELNPDIILCLGWSRLIKQDILQIPKFGVVGYHPTLLPKNRGRHPIIWALVLGLRTTGSTFFKMDAGADSGAILSQESVQIEGYENSQNLYNKLIRVAKTQLTNLITSILGGNLHAIPQDENKATYWRKRSKKDGIIDWRMSNVSIHNLVRALHPPYPGASFFRNNVEIAIFNTTLIENTSVYHEPGKVISVKGGKPVIKCGCGSIQLDRISPDQDWKVGEFL